MGFLRKTKSNARLAYRLGRRVQSRIGTKNINNNERDTMKTEEKLYKEWEAMKKRHHEAQAELQAEGNKAFMKLLAEQNLEREEMKKLLRTSESGS